MRTMKTSVKGAAVTTAALLLAAVPISTTAHAGGWEEGGFADAIMCDFDGDGTASEYVGVGTVSALVQLHEDGEGITHAVAMERHDGTEYYSVDVDESIYFTGYNRYIGTLDADLSPLDGRYAIDSTATDLDGNVVFTLTAAVRYTDGVLEVVDVETEGSCGMPYEPAE